MNERVGINRRNVFANFLWRFAERSGAQLVTFIVSIVLARLLSPSVYGLTALISVFISILQVFIDSGFGNALIQKKDSDNIDFSTVFYFNIIVCTILYLGMFFAAPLIARFYSSYDSTVLVSVIRVMSLTLIISGIKNVQQAYVSKTMQFKRFFFATLGGTIGSAVLGIVMAFLGYGVWALVAQNLFNSLVDTIILWITVKWRPQKVFSLQRLQRLFSFGWKLLVSSFLDTLYNNVRQLIIGKLYSTSDLAYYNKGKTFPNMIITNVNVSIDSVLLPSMSSVQDDRNQVKEITRRAMKTSTYIMAPLLLGLAFLASPVIRILLTDKWIEASFYMQIFCVTYIFYPVHTANLNAIKAMGRSDLFLKLEVIKKIVGIAALLVTMFISVKAMALSLLFTSAISQIINSWPNKRLLGYGYILQIVDILPGIGLALLMNLIIYPIQWIGLPDILTIVISVLLGAGIYICGSIILKLDSYLFIMSIIRQKRSDNKRGES